jgi:hypothetical protein
MDPNLSQNSSASSRVESHDSVVPPNQDDFGDVRTTSVQKPANASFLGSVAVFVVSFAIVSILIAIYHKPFAPSASVETSSQQNLTEDAVPKNLEQVGVEKDEPGKGLIIAEVQEAVAKQSDNTLIHETQILEITPDNASSAPAADEITIGEKNSSSEDVVRRFQKNGDDFFSSAAVTEENDDDADELAHSPYDAPEETRQTLAQIEHQFLDTLKKDVRDPAELLELLAPLSKQASLLLENANPELVAQVEESLSKIETFQKTIDENRDFFVLLEGLDQASLNPTATRAFFVQYQTYPNDGAGSPEVDAYRQEFAKVAASIETLEAVDSWNNFVGTYADSLERFYVSQDVVQAALQFISTNKKNQGMPQEFNVLTKRTAEWIFQLENVVPIQRKILLLLESEIAQKYWTYAPSVDKCYYLPAPPKPGVNNYVSDASGSLGQVDIPSDAEEVASSESKQTKFLIELSEQARQIPDSLQEKDPAKWYNDWCDFLTAIQSTDRLDPILQYILMRDCTKLLSSGNYYFQRRLAPILRMLNTPQIEEGVSIDRFQTDSQNLQKLRQLASSRISFLPKDHLVVNKTTAQLDAQVERIAFAYQRVGWLDRDFADVWKCRRPSNAELPAGDLYVVIPSETDSQSLQWFKIGSSDGKQTNLKLAANNVPRGSIIFCRVSLNQEKPIVKRASIEQFFIR